MGRIKILISILACLPMFINFIDCNLPYGGSQLVNHDRGLNGEASVSYYVWYDPNPLMSNAIPQKYFSRVKPQTRLWTVMKKAGRANGNLKLRYIQFPFGKYVTSIGGLKEDQGKNLHWMMYKLQEQPDPSNPPNSSFISSQGVDTIRISHNDVYLFWRNHFSH